MRFTTDTGGTFTDLIVEDDDGALHLFKSSTTPDDPIRGVIDVLKVAAGTMGMDLRTLLGKGELFIHGTTRAINAIITGNTARTALLTTKGNPDVLVFREGGRMEPFNFRVPYPDPYVPRALTFEVPERVLHDGTVAEELDLAALDAIIDRLEEERVEAIAVSLLWSIANPAHELKVQERLAERLPNVPVTLGHEVNPVIREYRRTTAAAIDASLKPLMADYMGNLEDRLREVGFGGRILVFTSQGGVLDAKDVARTPIHVINSGPAMAPVVGRYFADLDVGAANAIVADTGGTTYDVSLIRNREIPWAKETWIGQPFRGHMTGFPSVDVKSVGAGGGSIAWVDTGGMLHVGPRSAGAVPGPVAYGNGGTEPTVTDAALALGYLDPDNFLGGSMRLQVEAAAAAIERQVARPLGLSVDAAAAAILEVVTENMVKAIADITIAQGIDPASAVLIGGGGAAGLNSVLIARRLGCDQLIIPEVGPVLSASGGLVSDLSTHFREVLPTRTDAFDHDKVNELLKSLRARCEEFLAKNARGAIETHISFRLEGHYPSQVWDIDVPLPSGQVETAADVKALEEAFHRVHEELFAMADIGSPIEIIGWQAHVSARLRDEALGRMATDSIGAAISGTRHCYFKETGRVDTPVYSFGNMAIDERVEGPAIVESPLTTVVVDPGAVARRGASGSVIVDVAPSRQNGGA